MFIGELEVTDIVKSGESLEIHFEGEHPSVTLRESLYDIIKSEEKRAGNISDVVNHVLSTKFLSEMADFGLEFYAVEGVGTAMRVLAHNLREEL